MGNDVSAYYSLPASPIQFTYAGDAITCEFLIMTVGERGSNPTQRTRKRGRKTPAQQTNEPKLDASLRRASVAPSEVPTEPQAQPSQARPQEPRQPLPPPPASARPVPNLTPQLSNTRASASRLGVFDLRPTQQRPAQQMPSSTLKSESLFVDDDGGWEPVRDEDEEEEDNARLEWDHTAHPVSFQEDACCAHQKDANTFIQNSDARQLSRTGEGLATDSQEGQGNDDGTQSSYLDPTQRLSDVRNLALFPD